MRHELAMVLLVSASAGTVLGQVQTFPNNYAGFLQAAGSVHTIDFETLPDGRPSAGQTGTQITESFNYDAFGAHFATPLHYPFIGGNTTNGFDLLALELQPAVPTWLTADLVAPCRGVGVFFPGGTVLYAYGAGGSLLASVTYGASGAGHFLGIVSPTVPIERIRVDRNTNSEEIESFVFAAVPEPASSVLLGLGLGWTARSRKGRRPRCA